MSMMRQLAAKDTIRLSPSTHNEEAEHAGGGNG
jgi:hypothetical protein